MKYSYKTKTYRYIHPMRLNGKNYYKTYTYKYYYY